MEIPVKEEIIMTDRNENNKNVNNKIILYYHFHLCCPCDRET